MALRAAPAGLRQRVENAPQIPSQVRSEIASVAVEDGIRIALHNSPTQVTRIRFSDPGIKHTLGIFTLELHVRNARARAHAPATAVFDGGAKVDIYGSEPSALSPSGTVHAIVRVEITRRRRSGGRGRRGEEEGGVTPHPALARILDDERHTRPTSKS